MATMGLAVAQLAPARRDRDRVIAAGAGLLTKLELVRVAAEIGVEGERDEVLLDILWIDLVSGEPPGAVARAGASRSAEWAAVGGGKDHQRFVLGDGSLACLGDVGHPRDLPPWALAGLGFDHPQEAVEVT